MHQFAVCTVDETLDKATTDGCTVIPGPSDRRFMGVEASGMSLPHVAAHLVGGRQDYVDFAKRVHTRTDITWTSPLDEKRSPADFEWALQESVSAATCQIDVPVGQPNMSIS